MKFVPPYFYRPDVCQCQLCVAHRAEQEVQRVVRVLNSWPKGGVIGRAHTVRKPQLKSVKGARA